MKQLQGQIQGDGDLSAVMNLSAPLQELRPASERGIILEQEKVYPPRKKRRVGKDKKWLAEEEVQDEVVEKPILIQERVKGDTWKMLIATSLLNVTAGRLAIPIFWKLLEMWPDPVALASADEQTLSNLLQPLGLYVLRAKRLKIFSSEYLRSRFWLTEPGGKGDEYPDVNDQVFRDIDGGRVTFPPEKVSRFFAMPDTPPRTPTKKKVKDGKVIGDLEALETSLPSLPVPLTPPKTPCSPNYNKQIPNSLQPISHLSVSPFSGVGPYAIDSFWIYSPLLPGGGASRDEAKWIEKQGREQDRRDGRSRWEEGTQGDMEDGHDSTSPSTSSAERDQVDIGLHPELGNEQEIEAWRYCRPKDKELRRYLIWRWGIEGIRYDILRGPIIVRKEDLKRLGWMEGLMFDSPSSELSGEVDRPQTIPPIATDASLLSGEVTKEDITMEELPLPKSKGRKGKTTKTTRPPTRKSLRNSTKLPALKASKKIIIPLNTQKRQRTRKRRKMTWPTSSIIGSEEFSWDKEDEEVWRMFN